MPPAPAPCRPRRSLWPPSASWGKCCLPFEFLDQESLQITLAHLPGAKDPLPDCQVRIVCKRALHCCGAAVGAAARHWISSSCMRASHPTLARLISIPCPPPSPAPAPAAACRLLSTWWWRPRAAMRRMTARSWSSSLRMQWGQAWCWVRGALCLLYLLGAGLVLGERQMQRPCCAAPAASSAGSRPVAASQPSQPSCGSFCRPCLSACMLVVHVGPVLVRLPGLRPADGVLAQDSGQARQMWHLREGITEALRHRGALPAVVPPLLM